MLRVFEFLIVGYKPAGFDGKNEVRRRGFTPAVESFRGRQAIEAVIEFDCIEVLEVEIQHFGGGSFRGIERA